MADGWEELADRRMAVESNNTRSEVKSAQEELSPKTCRFHFKFQSNLTEKITTKNIGLRLSLVIWC